MKVLPLARSVRRLNRRCRQARMFARALRSPYQPVNAHIIPIRRCNLSCAYCNEYDDHLEAGACRQMSCGASICSRARHRDRHDQRRRAAAASRSRRDDPAHPRRGMIATLITNGYLLTPRADRTAESRRARSPADQHRQRGAGRNLQEEPEGAGPEAAVARRAMRSST